MAQEIERKFLVIGEYQVFGFCAKSYCAGVYQ